jgi:hypothetical protein
MSSIGDIADEHRWWHTLVSVLPRPMQGPFEKPPTSMTSLEDQLVTLTSKLEAEREEAAKHRAQFTKLVKILKRFAKPDVIAALVHEMPEIHSDDLTNSDYLTDLTSVITDASADSASSMARVNASTGSPPSTSECPGSPAPALFGSMLGTLVEVNPISSHPVTAP